MRDLLVLHAVPDLRRAAGGIAAILPQLCEALAREGVEARIITHTNDHGCVLADRTTLLAGRFPVAISQRIHAEIVRCREDAHRSGRGFVCHSHGIWSSLNHALAVAARSQRSPLVISLHGMLMPYARRHKALRKALAWHLYQARDLKRAEAIHVTSEAERAVASASGLHMPFAAIPFGVEAPHAESTPTSAAPAATSHASAQVRVLLFLGRIHPIKNIDGLIDAFARAQLSGWRLRIIGPHEGSYRDALRRLAEELGVAEQVSFEEPAFGETKARLLAHSDLLVLPSHSENFGLVVAEALACGTPAIASTGAPWSALNEHGCGWWVAPNPDALASAMRSAANTSPEALREMGARGRAYVQSNLTWQACGRKIADLYSDLVKEGVRPIGTLVMTAASKDSGRIGRALTFLLRGNYAEGNFGDDALAIAARRLLKPHDARIATDDGAARDGMWFNKLPGDGPDSRYDAIVYGGGTQLFSFAHEPPPISLPSRMLRKFTQPLGLIQSYRARRKRWTEARMPRLAIGFGVGPFPEGGPAEATAASLLKGMELVWVRDDASMAFCKHHGVANALRSTDLCFTNAFAETIRHPTRIRRRADQPKQVGIVLRDWHQWDEGYFESAIEAARRLRKQNVEPVFFSLARSDVSFLATLERSGECVTAWRSDIGDIEKFWAALAQMDLIVTARYHGAVFAVLSETPFLAVGIEPKLELVQNWSPFGPAAEGIMPATPDPDMITQRILAALAEIDHRRQVARAMLREQRRLAAIGERCLATVLDKLGQQ